MNKPTIGIIGAGRLGTAIARQAINANYSVRIANSRGPESMKLILGVLLPTVVASTVQEVAEQSDIIILAIPLNKYTSLEPEWFSGKLVIDAMNYWAPTEGYIKEFADESGTSSEYIQSYLPTANVIKSLNHIAYAEINEHSAPEYSPGRRAIAVAGDSKASKETVQSFINDLGFDAVDLGGIEEGRKFQPDTNLFNTRFTKGQLLAASITTE